jgi:hypothetical protein
MTASAGNDRNERRRRVVVNAWLLAAIALCFFFGFIIFTAVTG